VAFDVDVQGEKVDMLLSPRLVLVGVEMSSSDSNRDFRLEDDIGETKRVEKDGGLSGLFSKL